MEKKKLYVVSFGNSRKYLMEYTVPAHADQLRKPNPFAHIEAALRAYLERHLPEANDFTYYTSARATEVCSGHRDRYADYPALNDRSLQEIEHELLNEVRDGRANRRISLNAPFAQILGKIGRAHV